MRIISLSPSTTEILFAIGAGKMIVANTYFCDYPESAKNIPKVGSFSNVDDERIADFKPDLMITSTFVQNQSRIKYLKSSFKHLHLDPRSLNDIYENILTVGAAVSKVSNAKKLVAKMKKKEKILRKALRLRSGLPHRSRIYVEEWFEPPMGSGNWVPDIVSIAGGRYDLIPKGEISQQIPLEKIKKYDPEIIFVSYCGFKDKSDPEKILKREGWQNLTAVKKKRVYPINDDLLNRPGPRVLDAAHQIQKLLHSIQL